MATEAVATEALATEEVATEAVATEAVVEEAAEATPPNAPITMLEFGAVEERIEFGYGQYMSKAGARELVSIALSIAERNMPERCPFCRLKARPHLCLSETKGRMTPMSSWRRCALKRPVTR